MLVNSANAGQLGATDSLQDRLNQFYSKREIPPPRLVARGAAKPRLDTNQERLFEEAVRMGGRKPIYGIDNRKDFGLIRDPRVLPRAKASVALFKSNKLDSTTAASSFQNKSDSLGDEQVLCEGEQFASQLASSYCSGVLIDSNKVITAAHCIKEAHFNADVDPPQLSDVRFVFGYTAINAADAGPAEIEAANVFYASRLVASSFNKSSGDDWAVIELSRNVPASIAEPVPLSTNTPVNVGAYVYSLGYPDGLPLKFAPNAKVRSIDKDRYFVANIDTFSGNSGSGVFDSETNTLVGILVRGERDFVWDDDNICFRSLVCPTTGCKGEHVMRIELIETAAQ